MAAILTLMVTGCRKDTEPVKNGGTENNLPHITVMKPFWQGHIYNPDSELEKQMERAIGAEVTYQMVPIGQYDKTLRVKAAGNNLPDAVTLFAPNNLEHSILLEQGVFLPLNEWLDRFPKLKSAYSQEALDAMSSMFDGKIYGLPWWNGAFDNAIFFRKKWADKLGMQQPRTLDELVDMLRAFRNGDPDGNGKTDTIPLAFNDSGPQALEALFPLFGGGKGWLPSKSDPSRLEFSPITTSARNALQFARMLRTEGLLDPDLLTGKNIGIVKYTIGNIGVLIAPIGGYRSFLDLDVEIMDPIRNGEFVWSYQFDALPITRMVSITKQSKHPEAVLKLLEWQLTDGAETIMYGVEGKTYSIINGKKVPFPKEKMDPQYSSMTGLELLQPEWLRQSPLQFENFMSPDPAAYVRVKNKAYKQHVVYNYLRANVKIPSLIERGSQLRSILDDGYTKIINASSEEEADRFFIEMTGKWLESGGRKATEEVNKLQLDKSAPDYVK